MEFPLSHFTPVIHGSDPALGGGKLGLSGISREDRKPHDVVDLNPLRDELLKLGLDALNGLLGKSLGALGKDDTDIKVVVKGQGENTHKGPCLSALDLPEKHDRLTAGRENLPDRVFNTRLQLRLILAGISCEPGVEKFAGVQHGEEARSINGLPYN